MTAYLHPEIEQTQKSINSGLVWRLEGSAGRAAMQLINDGLCMVGHIDHWDFYGNHIPSRDQLKEGAKGTLGFVIEKQGQTYADLLEQVS